MQKGSLPVCLCQALMRVTESLSSVSLTKTKTLNERICVCIEIWTFHAQVYAFVCLTQGANCSRAGGSVVSGHAWIVALFSSIVQSQQQSVCHSWKHLSLLQHIKEDGHLLCFTAQGYHKVNTLIYSSIQSSALVLLCIWWLDTSERKLSIVPI